MLGLSGNGSARPTDIYTVDLATGAVTKRTRSAMTRQPRRLVRPQLVTYAAHDGLPLSGGCTGGGRQRHRAVVFDYHGGPEGQARPAMNGTTPAWSPAASAVCAQRARLERLRQALRQLDNGALRAEACATIEATTTRAWSSAGVDDPRRIGIMGGPMAAIW